MIKPLVAVIMGSKSDWETMQHADAVLTQFDVPHECRVLSAHRTPKETAEFVSTAESRGSGGDAALLSWENFRAEGFDDRCLRRIHAGG